MVCPDWTDPRNVGSAFRLADASGLAGVILAGKSPVPPNQKLSKTARSTERTVPWKHVRDLVNLLQEAKQAGALVIALEITDESEDLLTYELPANRPIYLIAGNEAQGVSQPLLDCCDVAVHLPMYGQNSSMNVAVAMAVGVYMLVKMIK